MMTITRTKTWPLILVAALALITAACQPAPEADPQSVTAQATETATDPAFPYRFTAPEGWRTEIVTFPLSFAPELDYEGHGDVRFAPGMFDPETDAFWTYSFVWWLPLNTEITPDRLSADMNTYFSGLAALIMTSREEDVPDYTASAYFTLSDDLRLPTTEGMSLDGRVETLDAFATQSPVGLNAHVDAVPCPDQSRLALIFGFSPQPYAHENWRALDTIRAGFQCHAE
ncbi:MAG: hypothetical protein ABJG15_05920 [Hyphomonadaceae bacterium]